MHCPKCGRPNGAERTHCWNCGVAQFPDQIESPESTKSKRNPVDFRYDILDPEFIKAMAMVAQYGAEKYGEYNWLKSRLAGEKGPINHIYEHLRQYRVGEAYDKFDGGNQWHLVAIAFNAMMEFAYTMKDIENSRRNFSGPQQIGSSVETFSSTDTKEPF